MRIDQKGRSGACYLRPTRTGRGESDSFPSRPTPVQGTVARSGEVLLLAFDPGEGKPVW